METCPAPTISIVNATDYSDYNRDGWGQEFVEFKRNTSTKEILILTKNQFGEETMCFTNRQFKKKIEKDRNTVS